MARKNIIRRFLDWIHLPNWVLLVLTTVMILRIPSFFEPFSYGDEMIYLALGEAVRRPELALYRDIHDNKPPLLYILAAIAGNVFWFRAILAFWHLGTVVIFWRLSETLFPRKKRLQKVSTWIFAVLTTLPLLEGNVANSEIFMIGPIMLAFYILLKKKISFKNLFSSGILLSIATLFKVPAAFDVPTIVVFWIILAKKLDWKNITVLARRVIVLSLGFILPLLATFVWYWAKGALGQYVSAAFLQNIGYLSSFRPDDVVEPFLIRNGPLLFRAGIVAVGAFILYLFRKKLSKQFVFVTLWLLFSTFAVLLSERPYPHYLIQSIPAISLLFGILIANKTVEQSLVIIPLFLSMIGPVYYNFWVYPTTSYYIRFAKFATGRISRETYFAMFDGKVNRNYEIAEFINISSGKKDSLFVWGNSSAIYALTRRLPPIRYVADYHISDFSNTKEVLAAIAADNPKFIVTLTLPPEEIHNFVLENYILVHEVQNAQIWKLLSPETKTLVSPT